MFLSIMVGGLSTQWYGCGGYNDYQAIARDRRLMFEKTTEQVAGAIDYGRTFVLLAAGVSAIVVAVLAILPRDHDGGHNDTTRDEGRTRSAIAPVASSTIVSRRRLFVPGRFSRGCERLFCAGLACGFGARPKLLRPACRLSWPGRHSSSCRGPNRPSSHRRSFC